MTAALAEKFDASISLSEAFGRVLASLPTAEDEVDAAVERMDKEQKRAERGLRQNINLQRELIQQLRVLVEAGTSFQIDDLIERCERTEERLQREFKAANKMAARFEKMLRHLMPEAQPKIAPRIEALRGIMSDYLADFQDIRWQLLAVRSSMKKDERGPVFERASDLRRHLAALVD